MQICKYLVVLNTKEKRKRFCTPAQVDENVHRVKRIPSLKAEILGKRLHLLLFFLDAYKTLRISAKIEKT